MKRLTKTELAALAIQKIDGYICNYGLHNTKKLTIALRREIKRRINK